MHDRRVHTCTTSRLHAVEVAANRGQAGRLRDGPEQRNRRGIGGEIAHTLCMPGSGQGWLLFFARDGFESSTAHRSHKKGWRMGRCRRGRCRRNADCRRRHEPAPEPHQNRRISRDGGSKALMSDELRPGLARRGRKRIWDGGSWVGEGAAYTLRPAASCGRLRYTQARPRRGRGRGGLSPVPVFPLATS